MSNNSSRLLPWFEKTVPAFVFVIIAFFTALEFFVKPYPGFLFSSDSDIILVFNPVEGSGLLQVGDQLVQVGPVSWAAFRSDPNQTLFDGVQPGDTVFIQILRDGKPLTISWIYQGLTWEQLLEEMNSEWWLPYIFWLAGTFTLFLIRPKDARWYLLIAFNYLTAVWFVAGMSSLWHVWISVQVLRTAVWLSIPVYLHLHWVFPQPLGRLPNWFISALYLFACMMAVLDLFQLLPTGFYQFGLLGALFGSLLLVLIRLRYPEQRPQVGFLAFAALLSIFPVIIAGIAPFTFQGGALLALPALPGAYFYTAYRQQLGNLRAKADRLLRFYIVAILAGSVSLLIISFFVRSVPVADSTFRIGVPLTVLIIFIAIFGFTPFFFLAALANAYTTDFTFRHVELRVNRLFIPYLFFFVFGGIITVVVLVADIWLTVPGEAALIGGIAAMLAGLITAVLYSPFEQFVEHRLLGIPAIPKQILEEYPTRIVSSLTKTNLVHLHQEQLLPTLLIRQSALFYFHKDFRDGNLIYSSGIDEVQFPSSVEMVELLNQTSKYRPPIPTSQSSTLYPWVRLILPLTLDEKPIGLWLLGRRDPDDLYAVNEIPTLQVLADQTSIALVNIMQAENLLALYQSNIDRHETERSTLALELHDETLNQLAVLSSYADERHLPPQFQTTYQGITSHIREIITGLRPAMLMYGLHKALDELTDHLLTRAKHQIDIRLEVDSTETPTSPTVNLYLYRIVQQAAENALRHSKATLLCISGAIKPNQVKLTVEDNGIGFTAGENLNLAALLGNKHYGLAGMFERAQLIGAELKINSTPGKGTQIVVSWEGDSPHIGQKLVPGGLLS